MAGTVGDTTVGTVGGWYSTSTLADLGGTALATGSAGLASTASLLVSGNAGTPGGLTLASTATASASGSAKSAGTAPLSSTGSIGLSSTASTSGSAALASTSTIAFGGLPSVAGSAALSSTATLSPGGSAKVQGTIGLASTSSLGIAGSAKVSGGAALGSSSTLSLSTTVIVSGSVPLSSTASLGISGHASRPYVPYYDPAFWRAFEAIPPSAPVVLSPAQYHVYANDFAGGSVNYASPIATVTVGTTYTTAPIPAGSNATFAVRAFDPTSGLEEDNVDCRVAILTDSSGRDVTSIPAAPIPLGATATAGGTARVDWAWTRGAGGVPTSFAVYLAAGTTISYSTPAVTIPYAAGPSRFSASISGLSDGVSYVVAVRAFNAFGHDAGTATVKVTGSSVGPGQVQGLSATAVISH